MEIKWSIKCDHQYQLNFFFHFIITFGDLKHSGHRKQIMQKQVIKWVVTIVAFYVN